MVDTGATRSTVRSVEVPDLPLLGKQMQVVEVISPNHMNKITKRVLVNIGNIKNKHQFIISDTSPVNLLGRDLLCKMNCVIYFTPHGVSVETHDEDSECKFQSEIVQEFPMFLKQV